MSSSSAKLCFDYDPLLYSAGGQGEKRSIKVTHKTTGQEIEFSNRTSFWGHHKTKAGGWLAMYNENKEEDQKWKPEDFIIEDIQTPEPIANCLSTLKQKISWAKEKLGVKYYYGYTGKGKVFRQDVSTVLKYKGNRDEAIRPYHLDEMKEYLIKHHSCSVVEEIETDDACSIDLYSAYNKYNTTKAEKDKLYLAFVDKDYWQCAGFLFNTNREIVFECDGGFGRLWTATKQNAKGQTETEVKGYGRMWLYFQVMNGDDSDYYFANSANPDVRWADMSAYNVLKNATNDKEAFEALVRGYKTIYPSPMKIIGWRGYEDAKKTVLKPNAKEHEIEVDWLYMLQENFTLAKMLRWRGDKVDVAQVMTKLGVEF